MQPHEEQIGQLVQKIVEAVRPLKVILFGSAARGAAGRDSDVDLLVVMPEGTHRRQTARYLYRVIEGIAVPFDVIVATPGDLEKHRDNPGLVYRTILREGKTLYAG